MKEHCEQLSAHTFDNLGKNSPIAWKSVCENLYKKK